MANTKDVLATTGKVAAGGAGAGAGGYFSFELFKDLDVSKLLQDHQVYGLTVLFFVAAIILATGYAALPSDRQQNMRQVFTRVVPALLVLSLGGYIFQMWQESRIPVDPPVSMRLQFHPRVADLNDLIGTSEQENPKFNASLSVELNDPHTILTDGDAHTVGNLHKNQLLEVMIPNLERFLFTAHQSRREADVCGKQSCDSKPAASQF